MRPFGYALIAGAAFLGACGNSDSGPANSGSAVSPGTGTGGAGTSGTSGSGGGGESSGGAGDVSGSGGSAIGGIGGGATSDAGGPMLSDAAIGDAAGTNGPHPTAGCAGKDYALCIDFENGIDTATWTGGSTNAIVTTDFA